MLCMCNAQQTCLHHSIQWYLWSSTHLSVSSEMKWHMDWRFLLWSHGSKWTNEQTNKQTNKRKVALSCWNCSWRVIATSFDDSSRTSDVYIVTSRSSFSSVPNYWYHQLAGGRLVTLLLGAVTARIGSTHPSQKRGRERQLQSTEASGLCLTSWQVPILALNAPFQFSMLNVPIVSGFRIVGSFSLKELFLQMSNCKANTT